LETEHLRWMGPFRFTLAALERIILPRTYKGKLHFLPAYDKLKVTATKDGKLACKYTINGNEVKSTGLDDDSKEDGDEFNPLSSKYDSVQPSDGWITMEGFFGLFLACNTSHIASDAHAAPLATFNDGLIDLLFSAGAVDRLSLISFMGKFEMGTHVTEPLVDYYKVKALVLEPIDNGCLSLDGERGNYQACKLESHKGILNLLG